MTHPYRVGWKFANGRRLVRRYAHPVTEQSAMNSAFYSQTFRAAGLYQRHPTSAFEFMDRIAVPVSVTITKG